jgi:hypothetical protein
MLVLDCEGSIQMLIDVQNVKKKAAIISGKDSRCYGEIRSFRCRLSFKRCLSLDFNGFLCGLEQEWAKISC